MEKKQNAAGGSVVIGGKAIGPGHPVYVVAEMSAKVERSPRSTPSAIMLPAASPP